ncbi:Gag-like protein [Plakobranchus ocellatus]|uniref:Gag-like protein n=1 Tax=Plakobranchus ocellatus TaxID=259542 RepID=A0AAV3ZGR9_9GAST|nr:Gag-like protein [Plakobranchus ocellatus]
MVELKSNDQAKKLGAITTFLDIPETVGPHKCLNSSKGVIRSRELRCCSKEEMVEELSGVTHARRIKVRHSRAAYQGASPTLGASRCVTHARRIKVRHSRAAYQGASLTLDASRCVTHARRIKVRHSRAAYKGASLTLDASRCVGVKRKFRPTPSS